MSRRKALASIALASIAVISVLVAAWAQRGAAPRTITSATVTQVERGAFPEVKLQLDNIRYSTDVPTQTYKRNPVTVRPVYTRTGVGRVNLASAATHRNLVAYYLIPGDRISARLIAPRRANEPYTITDITRVRSVQTPTDTTGKAMVIKTGQTSYSRGEPTRIDLAVTNTTNAVIRYQFSSGQQYDLWALRDGREVWRWSRGKFFTQALTAFTLSPGEAKTFTYTWDQRDNDGRQVSPGSYVIMGQLTTMSERPEPVSTMVRIVDLAASSDDLSAIIAKPTEYLGKTVSLSGVYYGWRPPRGIPGCDTGPPVTRSDWSFSDGKACIYVTGRTEFDPIDDVGKSVVVRGQIKRTDEGQVYLQSESVRVAP